MYDWGSETFVGGLGMGMSVPVKGAGSPRAAVPTRGYAAAGPGWMTPQLLWSVPNAVDDLGRQFGPRLYEAMLTDPAVAGSYNSVKLSVLEGGLKLTAPESYRPPAWYARQKGQDKPVSPRGDIAKPDAPETPDRSLSPDQQSAQDALDFCQRLVDRLGEDADAAWFGLCDAMAFGAKLAEITYKAADDGQDAGKLVWESVRVKPSWAWRFMVDSTMKVGGILTWDVKEAHYVVVRPDKFVWHTWMPRDGDPRGTSLLRAAYNAWNLKIQAWPLHYQFLVRFGSPGIDGEMAPGDTEDRPSIDEHGNPTGDGTLISASDYFRRCLELYRAGGVIVHPYESKVNVFEPKSSGEAFLAAFDLFDRQICLAIQLQARATMEAKNGSKADSESAQDTRGLVVGYGRASLAGVVRSAFRRALALNFGASFAEQFTPLVTFGGTEHQNRAELWTAAGTLGLQLGDSQKEELCADIGLPVPDLAADRQAQLDQMKAAAELMPKPAAPGVSPRGDTGKTDTGKADSKGAEK